jgi:hypothetical protein
VGLSKRELIIAIIALAAVLVCAGYYYAVSPFLDYRADVVRKLNDAKGREKKYLALIAQKDQLAKTWKVLLASGLKTASPDAESQALHAIGDWAQDSGINLSSLKPEHSTSDDKNQLHQIGFRASGTASWASIIRMLWHLESAPIPVHLTSLQITARKEASDDLAVQMGIVTVCYDPAAGKSKSMAAPAPQSEETP